MCGSPVACGGVSGKTRKLSIGAVWMSLQQPFKVKWPALEIRRSRIEIFKSNSLSMLNIIALFDSLSKAKGYAITMTSVWVGGCVCVCF